MRRRIFSRHSYCGKVQPQIFSPNGQYLLNVGGKSAFTFSFHCVQCDKYLIVSDRDEHCVKVFDTDATFLHVIGKQGREGCVCVCGGGVGVGEGGDELTYL